MPFPGLLLLLMSLSVVRAASGQGDTDTSWWEQRTDDLDAEYLFLGSLKVDSLVRCLSTGSTAELADVDAVRFDPSSGTCGRFACQAGRTGCRKCRNLQTGAVESDALPLPIIWSRRRNSDGRTTCWRTFQHRVSGSLDFERNWSDYVAGFSGPNGEADNYWMGLEQLHQLTSLPAQPPPVRWEFTDWKGSWHWMENTHFYIANAADKYRASLGDQLQASSSVTQCSMTSTSSMQGQMFSTHDHDNDQHGDFSCATQFRGAWWHQACFCMNPNGPYQLPPAALSLSSVGIGITLKNNAVVFPFNNFYSMRTVECLLMVDVSQI